MEAPKSLNKWGGRNTFLYLYTMMMQI